MPPRLWITCIGIFALAIAIPELGAQTRGPGPSNPRERLARQAANTDQARLLEASRFLSQASLGADMNLIREVARTGPAAWIDEQFRLAPGYHLPVVHQLSNLFEDVPEEVLYPGLFPRFAWMRRALTSPDVLRQRVALALSEIFVISDRVDFIGDSVVGIPSFYDVLLDGAFGNFRELLLRVTLHPSMGIYLSHLNNRKSDPATGQFPDENYAREVMQLFSIGLFELNRDGTRRLDPQGQPIPTYSNREITEFAKVFTGLGPGGPDGYFGGDEVDQTLPMRMYDDFHEPGEKRLLRGFVIPAGQSGMEDIHAAIDHLFAHPNVGPFIARKLIQRLVTSNPSRDYIARVAAAFDNNGQGVRGDMRAVIRQVLLDREARDWPMRFKPGFGRLREPFVRYVSLLRAFHVSSPSGWYLGAGWYFSELMGQYEMNSPSVFNFFLPDHRPNGELAAAGLVAPEFQITTSSTVLGMGNEMALAVLWDYPLDLPIEPCENPDRTPEDLADLGYDPCDPAIKDLYEAIRAQLDFHEEMEIADDPDRLLDRLDLLLTYGTLSEQTRAAINKAIAPLVGDPEYEVKLAVYLMMISPDYVVAK